MNKYLKTIERTDLLNLSAVREGETKLGQSILCLAGPDFEKSLLACEAKFVLLGIPEDIGVRANFGTAGTAGFWQAFLKTFVNIQSNEFLNGNQIAIAGNIICDDLMQQSDGLKETELSTLVVELDKRVEEIVQIIFKHKKIPIIVGGGHNNAYPLIKAAQKATGKKIGVINIDPHADLRSTERRHSGNGFSFALKEDLLEFYLQVGLHENYNNKHILDLYKNNPGKLHYFSYDGYLKKEWLFEELEDFIGDTLPEELTGLELDCDSIEQMTCSASTPSGFSASEIRELTIMITERIQPCYFHIPEAIASTSPINSAKLVSYLVTDFIKARD